jgi:TRAP-type C4-dicarboxylate transport system substrate-binding protein
MDKGIIDATWANWEMARAFKLQELTKYAVTTGLSTSLHVQVMNKDSFNKLPDAGKKYLTDNFDNFCTMAGTDWDGPINEVHQLLIDDPNITKVTLSADEEAKLDATLAPIVQQWVNDREAQGLPAKQAVTDLYNILVGLGVSHPFNLPQ